MGKIDMAFDSDRLLCVERALDIMRGVQEQEILRLLQIEEGCKKRKQKLPVDFWGYFHKQMTYWDICVELSIVVEAERKIREEAKTP